MNRGQIKTNVRVNLNDNGIQPTFFGDEELNESLQDAYNEVVCKTRCNIKQVTLNWPNATTYFDFINDFAVSDYLGTVAILNNVTNLFLRDDVSLRDYDRIRRDWELWEGNAQFWAPHSLQYIAITPALAVGTGTFKLYYYAIAPTLTVDATVPIIASDMQILLELYSTIDMLETAEEPSKGQQFNLMYYKKIAMYTERCQKLASADALLRV
jgi:hypothetical protein